ncbi:MAG: type VI secretion system ATPase TssH, partial [Planctomycetota bacterium]
ARESTTSELRRHFRPEFLNRVDEIVLFKPLTEVEIESIVDLMAADLSRRLADRNIRVELTDEARRFVAQKGFDPVYGARPLRRYLQRELETRVARALIEGELLEGAVVSVNAVGDELTVQIEDLSKAVS